MIRRACSSPTAARSRVRIIRACRELGIESRRVYSDADAARPARAGRRPRRADRAAAARPRATSTSTALLDAARDTRRRRHASRLRLPVGARALRAGRARTPASIFVGPPAEAIERMGSKIGARRADAGGRRAGRARRDARRPVRRGVAGRRGARVGFPVLVKPSAGGGGNGMQRRARRRRRCRGDRGGAPRSRRRRSATARSTSSGSSSARATSRSRCSATRTATSCTCSSASARCSAGTRR